MGTILKEGKAWSDASKVQHPANWALWSDSEKLAIGMEWVDPPASFDSRFYWDVGIEKILADSSDGTIGLKTQYKNKTKETAHSLLQPTDWYVIRKYEDSTKEIPTKIANYRAAVRTAANVIETKIDAASNLADFIKLIDSSDPNSVSDIDRWPEEV